MRTGVSGLKGNEGNDGFELINMIRYWNNDYDNCINIYLLPSFLKELNGSIVYWLVAWFTGDFKCCCWKAGISLSLNLSTESGCFHDQIENKLHRETSYGILKWLYWVIQDSWEIYLSFNLKNFILENFG